MMLNRVSLNTIGLNRIGLNRIGKPSRASSDRPYIDPEVLASLKAVCICYGKSNDDPDRAVVKNLVDPDNPFVISNAAFKLNSGFGEYSFDFERWGLTKPPTTCIKKNDSFNITYVGNPVSKWLSIVESSNTSDSSIDLFFKVEITGLEDDMEAAFVTADMQRVLLTNGINVVNITIKSKKWYGFNFIRNDGTALGNCNIVVRQIPEFQGAFVTDGIDDLITSTKTVQEMLGGSNEITVVSLITHISGTGKYNIIGDGGIQVSDYSGQTFMAGTSSSGEKIVELGDKEKLQAVQYTTFDSKLTIGLEDSSYAYYGTFVFNKENVPVDWIHQVIAYFNLDRTLNPDILCDVKKQGITNENHAEFGDKLIDFSGNGRDIQLNNLAWKGGSGIAAKQYETFKDWTNTPYQTSTVTEIDEFTRVVDSTSNAYWVSMINRTSDFDKVHDSINIVLYQDDMLLVHECKYKIDENVTTKALYETLKSGVNTITLATIDKFTDIPEDAEIMSLGEWVNPKSNKGSVKITLLPSYEGGVLLDGINDFGKVTGMPIYKDYTFIIDYERISYTSEGWGGAIVSKSPIANNGAFISMMANSAGLNKQLFSFGGVTTFIKDDLSRILFWQTKYKSENTELTVGEGVDGDTLWLGAVRDNDSRFFNGAIYSLMSFPYSMSEFLIERQLKKHKLGTLYPDMVEFRPIVKQDDRLKSITYYINQVGANIGQYYPIGSGLGIAVETVQPYMVKSLKVNGVNTIPNADYKGFNATLDSKFPQKITMDIQVDSSLVQWNPVVESNVEYSALGYLNYSHNLATIKVGDYISIGDTVAIRVVLGNTVDEVVNCKVNGQECEIVNVSPRVFDCKFTLTSESPQKINITIYQPPEYLTMLSNSTLISNETLIKNE